MDFDFLNNEEKREVISKDIKLLLYIVNKEFRHLLHVENRASICLAIISFLTIAIITVYVKFRLPINCVMLIISFIILLFSLILIEFGIHGSFGVKLPSKGIISHRSLRGVNNVSEYIQRFYSFQKDKKKIIEDLSAFAIGIALMAAFKKVVISIATYFFILTLILNIISLYVTYNYKEGVKHLFPLYFIAAFLLILIANNVNKIRSLFKKKRQISKEEL